MSGDDDLDEIVAEDTDDADDTDTPDTPVGGRVHHLEIEVDDLGGRLDAVLAAHVEELSRAMVQRLIEDGQATIGDRVVTKPGHRLHLGDRVELVVPPPISLELVAEPIPLTVLFEDAELIVIDKPAGMVVHPAVGHPRGTLVNALLHHCTDLSGIGGVLRPGIVHRLDKDTSGVIVATKTDRAHAALTAAFAAKSRGEPGGIERTYLAIAAPPPVGEGGTVRTSYGRHPIHRKQFSSKVAGKSAVTHWQLVEALGGAGLLQLRLETGRTHQIRVHGADHGWPLLGDPVYGSRPRDSKIAAVGVALGRQALHARVLAFDHPVTGARHAFESPLPADLEAALAALRALA